MFGGCMGNNYNFEVEINLTDTGKGFLRERSELRMK